MSHAEARSPRFVVDPRLLLVIRSPAAENRARRQMRGDRIPIPKTQTCRCRKQGWDAVQVDGEGDCGGEAGLKIVAVDNFSWNPFGLPPQSHEAFTRRILDQEIRRGQIEILNTSSAEYRERVVAGAVPDAIFFDAQHQYEPVKAEIEWAKNRGIPLISGHDYGNPNPRFGVTRAVNEAFGTEAIETVGMCWRAI